jgi:cation:H+ antiporter
MGELLDHWESLHARGVTLLPEIATFAFGIALLIGGAWLLVTGGARIAELLGVAPVVIGLTIVAFGTSAPELFVCLVAALRGNADLMLGNIVGSNLANLGLILGAAALIMPVAIDKHMIRLEIPLLLFATLLFAVLCWDHNLGRLDGLWLVLLFGFFMLSTLRSTIGAGGRKIEAPELKPGVGARRGFLVNGGLVAAGVAGLVGGGHFLVGSAVTIATRLGASESLIGLTLVAVGTSLPELATTIVASVRKEGGIALGNVVGSNLFNLLAVGGTVALIHPVAAEPTLLSHQIPGMAVMTLALPLLCLRRDSVGRAWGGALLLLYAVILAWWLAAGV